MSEDQILFLLAGDSEAFWHGFWWAFAVWVVIFAVFIVRRRGQ